MGWVEQRRQTGGGQNPAPPLPDHGSGRRSGRGLSIVRDLCESLEFNERGNVARATCPWDGPLPA